MYEDVGTDELLGDAGPFANMNNVIRRSSRCLSAYFVETKINIITLKPDTQCNIPILAWEDELVPGIVK